MIVDNDIAVAIATYNGEKYLTKQLDSILGQSVLPREIIVCDDCSIDGTLSVVEQVAARSVVPIRCVQNEVNLGYAGNFLKAANLTGAEYVAFCDQDDIWHPDKIKKTMEALRRDKSLMAIHNALLIDESDNVIGQMRQCESDTVLPPCSLDPWKVYLGFTQTVSKRIFNFLPFDHNSRGKDINNTSLPLGHDAWTTFVASTFGTVSEINLDLVSYRQHRKNVYGYRERSLWSKMIAKITEEQSRVERMLWLYEIAQFRADSIAEVGHNRPDYLRASRHWQRVATQSKGRLDLTRAKGVFERCHLFYRCWLQQTYKTPAMGGLGSKRLFEDAVMGVLGISLRSKEKGSN